MEYRDRSADPIAAVQRPVGNESGDHDLALVRRLVHRDREALRELYELHGQRVYRVCLRMLGRAHEAEDATQETFLRLFERAADFDGRSRFTTWLHRVTTNLCLKILEKERFRRVGPLPGDGAEPADEQPQPAEVLERQETEAALAALLARLSPDHRSVIVLRELEGLSYEEIAEALDVPVGTVMSRLARAREQVVQVVRRPVPLPAPLNGGP